MRKFVASLCLLLGVSFVASAEKLQGLLVAQSCVEDIVKNGREATLKQKPDCSLRKNYVRPAYALVTDSKKYFTFDPYGNKKALQLLKGTPDPDNLKVVVTGQVTGDTIAVKYMSIL